MNNTLIDIIIIFVTLGIIFGLTYLVNCLK